MPRIYVAGFRYCRHCCGRTHEKICKECGRRTSGRPRTKKGRDRLAKLLLLKNSKIEKAK